MKRTPFSALNHTTLAINKYHGFAVHLGHLWHSLTSVAGSSLNPICLCHLCFDAIASVRSICSLGRLSVGSLINCLRMCVWWSLGNTFDDVWHCFNYSYFVKCWRSSVGFGPALKDCIHWILTKTYSSIFIYLMKLKDALSESAHPLL